MVSPRLRCLLVLLCSIAFSLGGAHPAARAQDGPRAELAQLFQIGQAALDKKDHGTAMQAFQSALARAQQLGDRYSTGVFLDCVANTFGAMGQLDRAIALGNQALQIRIAEGDKKDIARTLNNLAVHHRQAGQLEKSAQIYAQCLTVWEQVGDPNVVAQTAVSLGNVHLELKQTQKALDLHLQALRLRERLGNPKDISSSLSGVASVYVAMRHLDKAVESLNRALSISQAAGDTNGTARSLSNLGAIYFNSGEYDRALTHYQRELDLEQRLGDKARTAGALSNIGLIHSRLGQHKKGIEFFQRSLALQDGSNTPTLANTLLNLSGALIRTGEAVEAVRHLTRLAALHERGSPDALAGVLTTLGQAYGTLRQYDRAMDALGRALPLVQKSGDERRIAGVLNDLGATCKSAGQYDKAVDYLTRSLELKKRFATRQEIAVSLTNLALIYTDMGQLEKAAASFVGAIESDEYVSRQVRDASKVGEYQDGLKAGMYGRYAAVLLRQGKAEDALAVLERGRGQGLARQVSQNRADLSRTLPAADAERLKAALADFQSASEALRQAEPLEDLADVASVSRVGQEVLNTRRRFDDSQLRLTTLRNELAVRSPAYRRLSGAVPPTFSELKALAGRSPDTLFVEWSIGAEKTSLVFALSEKDGLKAFVLPVGEDELRKQVRLWRAAVSEGEGDPQADAALSRSLYSTLFGELEKAGLLAQGRYARLVLVGDGPLLELPFAALTDGTGKRLVERFPISVAVSLAVLAWPAEREKPGGTLLCAADPLAPAGTALKDAEERAYAPLPAAREEGKAVSALFPGGRLLIGPSASKKQVHAEMAKYRILHFATHGYFDDEDGLRSGLALAPEAGAGGDAALLEAREIVEMRLAAELAVLPACETGQGKKSGGEGLLGLTWAFRAAGCPSVVASLWSVDDSATGQLMVTFYQALRAGKRKDDALREAMLKVKAGRAHPFYWAAFQVVGDTQSIAFGGPAEP